jgi:hypothetical protein
MDHFHFVHGRHDHNYYYDPDPIMVRDQDTAAFLGQDDHHHYHPSVNVVGLGLLSLQVGSQGCMAWSHTDASLLLGNAWKVASACALAGNIIIGLCMFLSFCLAWFHFSKTWRMGLVTMLLLGSFCEALTVVALADDVCRGAKCQFSINLILSIMASIVAFLSAVMALDIIPSNMKTNDHSPPT